MINVAINGFGRIGRTALKAGWGRKGIRFVGVNDLTEPRILAHLLQYDSVFRTWDEKVSFDEHHLIVGGHKIPVLAEKDPAMLPWKKMKVDVVIESTGRFSLLADASKHLAAGAKNVVISAPSKNAPTYLMGVNHGKRKASEHVICNASCTTNSVAPVAQVMEETFGIKKAMLTTVHSATMEQNLVDGLPPGLKSGDLRRARSALVNIVPTSTGAAQATAEAIPSLKNKFNGLAVRVPTLDVSLTDFTCLLKRSVTVEEVNRALKEAAKSARWKGILGVTEEPLVSSDFIGSPYASVADLSLTRVVDGDLVKIMAWYDNEWGYSVHLMDLVQQVGK